MPRLACYVVVLCLKRLRVLQSLTPGEGYSRLHKPLVSGPSDIALQQDDGILLLRVPPDCTSNLVLIVSTITPQPI